MPNEWHITKKLTNSKEKALEEFLWVLNSTSENTGLDVHLLLEQQMKQFAYSSFKLYLQRRTAYR